MRLLTHTATYIARSRLVGTVMTSRNRLFFITFRNTSFCSTLAYWSNPTNVLAPKPELRNEYRIVFSVG